MREEAVERHSTARDGPSGRADVRGEGDGNETRGGTVRERERDFVRRRIYGVDGAENARGEDEEREDNGEKKVPSRTVSSISDADERNVGRSAERSVRGRRTRGVECRLFGGRERRGGRGVGGARRKEAERARKVGEHSRAANVEGVLVSRVFVRAGAVRTRRFASGYRERHVRTASARERRGERKGVPVYRGRVRVVPRRNRRQRVPDSRSHV